jgi:hypothetical protein
VYKYRIITDRNHLLSEPNYIFVFKAEPTSGRTWMHIYQMPWTINFFKLNIRICLPNQKLAGQGEEQETPSRCQRV